MDREFYETVIEFRADGIARTKDEIDGLTKSMNLIKATMSVLESSGSDVDENRISEIDIRMHLDEDDDSQE